MERVLLLTLQRKTSHDKLILEKLPEIKNQVKINSIGQYCPVSTEIMPITYWPWVLTFIVPIIITYSNNFQCRYPLWEEGILHLPSFCVKMLCFWWIFSGMFFPGACLLLPQPGAHCYVAFSWRKPLYILNAIWKYKWKKVTAQITCTNIIQIILIGFDCIID